MHLLTENIQMMNTRSCSRDCKDGKDVIEARVATLLNLKMYLL